MRVASDWWNVSCALLLIFDHETAAEVADELAEEIAGYGDGPEYDAILAFGAFSYPGNKRANEAMMRVRRKLDAGLGEQLFGEYRACKIGITQDVSDVEIAMQGARFKTLILAALMMGVGARITDTEKAHLRKVCAIYDGFLPECGVVGSGERQFLFALRTYTAGKPRDWTRLNCCKLTGALRLLLA
ncbi:uncharacterized protein C8A04DRAFT_28435 [Dichotomopilus funicola]|uniref:Uncharacterized protein n=1 Tax=Dichotomopilus funicola TaxID=1934379 RepID=A0AAN6V5F6_9PEZI|nr:hypothetical protein C8A04DRAFT_28435 [Dichotomopilus funicola]